MGSHEIFDFTRTGVVSISEANQIARVLYKITQKHSHKVDQLISKLEITNIEDLEKTKAIESEINHEIDDWQCKVRKLAGLPKGLWHVDIDSGDGYYCWKFPEQEITYWHNRHDGHAARINLAQREALLKDQRRNENSISPNKFAPR